MASAWAISALVGLASCTAVNVADAAEGTQLEPCRSEVVRDYKAALEGMPPNRTPAGGPLPFAPPSVSLLSLGLGKTVLQGSEIGYRVEVASAESSSGFLRHPVELHWEVRMRLWRVNRRGRPLQIAAEKFQRVGKVRHPDRSTFFLRSKPGIYRFDMAIRKKNGRLLKSYVRYVRVLPRQVRLMIAMNQREFQAGEVAIGRIQNLGTLPAFLVSQPYLDIERFSDGEWKSLAADAGTLFAGLEGVLFGGRAGPCKRFAIPLDATDEHYRFSAGVETSLGGSLREKTLTSAFSVE
jgi:hypothetical protein